MGRQTIKALRLAAGLTQRALATRIGVTTLSVSNWETGRNEPSARQLRAVAEALGVSMDGIAFERAAARQSASRDTVEEGR
jgi:transcriptional regulator with XRE-family HTH domain